MAVKIRMRKMGSKKRPFFRIVATDSRSPRDGRFIEILGYYNPMVDPPEIKFDDDEVYKWLDVGAEPSSNVAQLFKKAGLLERWQLLKQGVKISELDAKIAERREKQPKPKPKEERKAEEKKKDEKGEEEQAAEDTKEVAENEQENAGGEGKTEEPHAEPEAIPAPEPEEPAVEEEKTE